MRMMGGVVAALLLLATARAEVVCVHFKKDGTLNGALKVRTACKRREVQVDPAMLGLCCDGSTTTTTSITTTTMFPMVTTTSPIGTTSTTFATGTTSTTFPAGTTSTSVSGSSTSTSSIVTTTVTSTVTSSVVTTVTSVSTTVTFIITTSTTTTTTTTSLVCPSITTTTIIVNFCGGSPTSCNGYCGNGKACVTPDGLSCQCVGPLLPCGMLPDGTCGGDCPGGGVCTQTVNVGGDGCPKSFGCACIGP